MGAHPYWYFEKYAGNVEASLRTLREREFNAGRYNPVGAFPEFPPGPHSPSPGAQHATIEEVMEDAAEDGTRSILDLDHVSDSPDFCAVAPLPDDVLENLYGTETPTRQMVEQNRLWMEQATLADLLKKQGYRTANIGKWHLSGNNSDHSGDELGGFAFKPPHERGFDEFVGIRGGMHTFWKGTSLARLTGGKYERFESPDYLTDFFGSEACDFIQRQKEGPFFLYLAFNAPHAPLQGLNVDQSAIDAPHISRDPAELNDLASEFPDKVNERAAAFRAWQMQMPRPIARQPGASKWACSVAGSVYESLLRTIAFPFLRKSVPRNVAPPA